MKEDSFQWGIYNCEYPLNERFSVEPSLSHMAVPNKFLLSLYYEFPIELFSTIVAIWRLN